MVVTGNIIAGGGEIQIDGTVEGDIRSVLLTVGDKATVHGEVVADEVTIRGRIIGSVRARKVQLSSTSHVEGDIIHEALAVESGAFFQGNCRHSDDPMSEPANPTPRRRGAPARDVVPEDRGTGAKGGQKRGGFLGARKDGDSVRGDGGVVVKDGSVVVKNSAAD